MNGRARGRCKPSRAGSRRHLGGTGPQGNAPRSGGGPRVAGTETSPALVAHARPGAAARLVEGEGASSVHQRLCPSARPPPRGRGAAVSGLAYLGLRALPDSACAATGAAGARKGSSPSRRAPAAAAFLSRRLVRPHCATIQHPGARPLAPLLAPAQGLCLPVFPPALAVELPPLALLRSLRAAHFPSASDRPVPGSGSPAG